MKPRRASVVLQPSQLSTAGARRLNQALRFSRIVHASAPARQMLINFLFFSLTSLFLSWLLTSELNKQRVSSKKEVHSEDDLGVLVVLPG